MAPFGNMKARYVELLRSKLRPTCMVNNKGHSLEYWKVFSDFGKKIDL